MLIDRTHKPWIFGSALTLAVSASAYWATSRHLPHGASGGSVSGLVFGVLGSLLMVFAALLAVRKRLPTWRVGSAQLWLRGHLWLGTLGFVLILFHAGFGWGGLLENLLWISFGLVVATGIAGVILQQVIPRLLTSNVPLETMVAQIPFLSRTMQFRADQLVAKQAGVLDIEFESIKPFAEEVLKQQRVLKRESDFPKELAKVYANVPLPEGDAKKPHAPTPAPIVATKPAAAPVPVPVAESGQTASVKAEPSAAPVAATTTDSSPAKPKSPLELMREKAAAKAAASESAAAPTEPAKKLSPIEQMRAKAAAAAATTAEAQPTPSEPAATAPEKKLSPIEQMRAKMAAKSAPAPSAEAPVVEGSVAEANSKSADEPAPPAAEPVKKLSPIEQMRAKKAAAEALSQTAPAPAAPVVETLVAEAVSKPADEPAPPAAEPVKKLSPIEQMRAKKAAAEALSQAAPTPDAEAVPVAAPEKKLSPMEQMKAKLAAAKSATEPSEHKPLTIDKSADAPADKPAPPVKKPTPIVKPSAEKPAAVTPVKPAVPVPPALLAELRDFHVRVVRSFLVNGRSPQYRLDDDIASRRVFAQLRSDLPAELHDVLQQLEDLCLERRQFNTQLRLHRWLHWWLILHIPPSIALLVLFVAHVIVSLRVVPFGK